MLALRFTATDLDRANAEWGCNCGPGALAGLLGLTLDEVRPHLNGFEAKGYTNPTMMFAALTSLGASWFRVEPATWPRFGLARVQWEGPWTAPGVPMRARYRYTHWVAGLAGGNGADSGVFDINSRCGLSGESADLCWCSLGDWAATVVPALVAGYKRATGRWHITHMIEIDRGAWERKRAAA